MQGIAGLWVAAALGSGTPAPPPQPIVNGEDALECEWPSTVAFVLGGSQFCSATLVHPELVLTAAHCIHPASGWGEPGEILFGESIDAPARTVTHSECQIHPMYDPDAATNSPEDKWDLAWCRLSAPVTDIPVTPLISGCELDQLDGDAEVHVVGFGAYEIFDDGGGGFTIAGNGVKRHTVHAVEEIDADGQLYLVGEGEASACSGDSGGSVYVQLDDGSWRTVGAIARVHPDSPDDPPWCLYGLVATGVFTEMEWLEQTSGIDVSPCFLADGTWAPTEGCDAFPLDPLGEATWAAACGSQPKSGPIATCGPAFGESEDTGGDTTTTGGGSGSDGGGADTTGSADGAESSSTGDPMPPDLDLTTSSADTTGDVDAQGDEADGCGCRSRPGDAPSWLLALATIGLGGLRRRRAPPSAKRTSGTVRPA